MLWRIASKSPNTQKASAHKTKWVIAVVITILSLTVCLYIYRQWIQPNRSLLTQTPGLTLIEDMQQLNNTVTLPTSTFGAKLYQAGLYTQPNDHFPSGTIAVVYTKDNWRFVEIDYLPNQKVEEYISTHPSVPKEQITLPSEQPAWLLKLDTRPRCIDYKDATPNRCEISSRLVFHNGRRLVTISVDGHHATVGELTTMAKEILNP